MSNIDMEPVDISLIKKYKTVDVPCIQSAIGNILSRNPCRDM